MKARIWGCRGSLATPGPHTVKYGGNTTCVEVRTSDDALLILDAGTGIRPLGESIAENPPDVIHLFLTHLHMDHMEGLGFFSALWRPDIELHVWGPPSPWRSLEELLVRYLSPPLFPIHLGSVPSKLIIHDLPHGELQIGSARIFAEPVLHSGTTVGYRVSENGKSMAFIPDHEPGRALDLTKVDPEWVSGFNLAHQVDLLFHDSQYTENEYKERVGWGHSSVEHVVEFTAITEAKKLLMFHHDPTHSDDALELHLERARSLWGNTGSEPQLAEEGMEITI